MNEVLNLAKSLINIESVSNNEEAALKFIEEYLGSHKTQVWRTNDFTAGLWTANKSSDRPKKAIILTGHIDTVVAGELSNWKKSPWDAEVNEGKLVGLGASDMKAGLAAQLRACIDYTQQNEFDFDLWFVAVSREELDGSGSAAFVDWFNKNEFNYDQIIGLIAEPTGNSQIEIGHRGNRFVRLKFLGESGHASQQTSFKSSALYKSNAFLDNIEQTYINICERFSNEFLGQPSIVPTSLNAGDEASPNKAAANAGIILDIRTTPELDDNFDSFMNELAEKFDFVWEYHSNPVKSSLIGKESPVIQKLIEAANLSESNLTVSPGATDQGEFVNGLGAEVIVFGPGEFSQAHQPNEYIYTDKLKSFYKIILSFLGK